MSRKTWFVTGASRGIGLGLVHELLGRGFNVIGACRNPDGQRDFWELKRDYKDRFDCVRLDVSDLSSIQSAASQMKGRVIDVLVNNAGVLKDGDKNFPNMDMTAIKQSFDVNTIGPMLVTREFLPQLIKASEPKVANITSLMGSIADNKSGGYYGYRMSKTALNMFSVCLAREFPEMTVLTLHPGWVKTEMGGPQAPTEARDSAAGLVEVIEKATLKDSGLYMDYRGRTLPW